MSFKLGSKRYGISGSANEVIMRNFEDKNITFDVNYVLAPVIYHHINHHALKSSSNNKRSGSQICLHTQANWIIAFPTSLFTGRNFPSS